MTEIDYAFYGSKKNRPEMKYPPWVPNKHFKYGGHRLNIELHDCSVFEGFVFELAAFGPKLLYQDIVNDPKEGRIIPLDKVKHLALSKDGYESFPTLRIEECIVASCRNMLGTRTCEIDPPHGIRLTAALVDGTLVQNGFYVQLRSFGLCLSCGCFLIDLDRKILIHPNEIAEWKEEPFRAGDELLIPIDSISNCTF